MSYKKKTKDFYQIVIQKLERICCKKNITLDELALASGLKKDKFQKIYSGKSKLNIEEVVDICEYLEITPDDIVP